ncbi:hypothetical protein N0V85_003768 [Neurospora sp. IMI 360204]|nr:hypothetical protein N0V85_003768 [Neurospora sp. IMI 360204]
MLEHRMSTAAGESGAPIIQFGFENMSLVPEAVIGTHCLGAKDSNYGSVIGPPFGNDFTTLLSGLSQNGSPLVVELPLEELRTENHLDPAIYREALDKWHKKDARRKSDDAPIPIDEGPQMRQFIGALMEYPDMSEEEMGQNKTMDK